jgi:hypothetical protein
MGFNHGVTDQNHKNNDINMVKVCALRLMALWWVLKIEGVKQ